MSLEFTIFIAILAIIGVIVFVYTDPLRVSKYKELGLTAFDHILGVIYVIMSTWVLWMAAIHEFGGK